MSNFRTLGVWHKARALALRSDVLTARFRNRRRALADQLEKAVDKIPAIIAEGKGRATDADFAHYMTMAIASTNEVENHFQRALDKRVITQEEFDELTNMLIEVRKMSIGLRKTLRGE